jgi:hypothetical protein
VTRRIALGVLLALAAGASADPLEEKAIAFRANLVQRHLSPEGIVLYRVDLETIEQDLERGTYPDLADAPTFTGMFAATSCLRAELTFGEERREASHTRPGRGREALVPRGSGVRGVPLEGGRLGGSVRERTPPRALGVPEALP